MTPLAVTGYAYPWDVAEAGFTDRAAGLGVDQVAVATAYHSTRAATPWSRSTTSVRARHAAFYRPVRPQAWRDCRLRPLQADWVADPDSAASALHRLESAGLGTAAWVVLTHSSVLGEEHPGLTVRNCLDEPYPWALCPSRAEVRDYAATLVAESLRGLDVSTVVLEACGQLGVVHQCRHEKTDAVWSPALVRLLSICCCEACAARWDGSADAVRTALRQATSALLSSGDLDTAETGVPDDLLAELLAVRHRSTDELLEQVLTSIDGDGATTRPAVALHASADPWATGALPGLTDAAAAQVDSVVLPAWQPGPDTVAATDATRRRLPSTSHVGSYVTAVAPRPLADAASYVRELRGAGADELHLYHLGLASPARWPDLRSAAEAAREPASETAPDQRS